MSTSSDQVVLKVENIVKVFESAAGRVAALRGVNLSIRKGEFVAIVGPSGSGKSTLLNMIGALDRPTSGEVFINGVDVFSLSDGELATMRNHLIGFIFQSYNLINRTTVMKNVELPSILTGTDGGKRHQRAMKILDVDSAGELAGVMACVGLAQNLAAIKALATHGIQKGHMRLHARQVALAAGAAEAQVQLIADQLVAEGNIRVERARELITGNNGRK